MERTRMEVPSAILEHLGRNFLEIQRDSDIAYAEPKNEFPTEAGVKLIGVADKEMKVWWALIERWRFKKDSSSLGQANYDALVSIFRVLVTWKSDKVIGPDDELAMYKGWIIGTSTPQSRLAPVEHGRRASSSHHQF